MVIAAWAVGLSRSECQFVSGLSPALVLGLLLSIGYASLLHVWSGRNLRDLLVYCVAGLLGFAVGQFFGEVWGNDPLQIGQTNAVSGSVGAWILLISTYYLTR